MEGLDGAQAADTPRLTKEPGSGSDQEPLSTYHQLCWQLLAWLPKLSRAGPRPHAGGAEGPSPHLRPGFRRPDQLRCRRAMAFGQTSPLRPRTGHLQGDRKEAAAWCEHQMWQVCSHQWAEVALLPFLRSPETPTRKNVGLGSRGGDLGGPRGCRGHMSWEQGRGPGVAGLEEAEM